MLKPKNVIDREDKGEIVEAEGGGTMTKVYCTAIVLAAGSGKRMGTKVHKQYLQLCEKPVLAYSLQAFQQSDLIDEIILVVGKGEEEFCRTEIVEKYGFFKSTENHMRRRTEISFGLERFKRDKGGICIHP